MTFLYRAEVLLLNNSAIPAISLSVHALMCLEQVADIMSADSEDESLRKYKESLLGAAATGDLGDASVLFIAEL